MSELWTRLTYSTQSKSIHQVGASLAKLPPTRREEQRTSTGNLIVSVDLNHAASFACRVSAARHTTPNAVGSKRRCLFPCVLVYCTWMLAAAVCKVSDAAGLLLQQRGKGHRAGCDQHYPRYRSANSLYYALMVRFVLGCLLLIAF